MNVTITGVHRKNSLPIFSEHRVKWVSCLNEVTVGVPSAAQRLIEAILVRPRQSDRRSAMTSHTNSDAVGFTIGAGFEKRGLQLCPTVYAEICSVGGVEDALVEAGENQGQQQSRRERVSAEM